MLEENLVIGKKDKYCKFRVEDFNSLTKDKKYFCNSLNDFCEYKGKTKLWKGIFRKECLYFEKEK